MPIRVNGRHGRSPNVTSLACYSPSFGHDIWVSYPCSIIILFYSLTLLERRINSKDASTLEQCQALFSTVSLTKVLKLKGEWLSVWIKIWEVKKPSKWQALNEISIYFSWWVSLLVKLNECLLKGLCDQVTHWKETTQWRSTIRGTDVCEREREGEREGGENCMIIMW